MQQQKKPKNASLESLFAFLTSEDASVDPDLAYGTTSEPTWSSDESLVVIKHSNKNRPKSELGDIAEENTARQEAKMSDLAESRKGQSDPEETDSKAVSSETQTDQSVDSADYAQQCCSNCATLGREFEDKVLLAVADLMDTHIRAVIPVLVDEAVREATQDLHQVAQDAAQDEMHKHIVEACYESTEEKMKAITTRLEELDENTLERVFMQKSMLDILKRLVEKAETDLALMEWEKV